MGHPEVSNVQQSYIAINLCILISLFKTNSSRRLGKSLIIFPLTQERSPIKNTARIRRNQDGVVIRMRRLRIKGSRKRCDECLMLACLPQVNILRKHWSILASRPDRRVDSVCGEETGYLQEPSPFAKQRTSRLCCRNAPCLTGLLTDCKAGYRIRTLPLSIAILSLLHNPF